MRIVFFDLETGGLDPKQHPITQIAAVAIDLDTGEELGEFEAKLRFDPSTADPASLELTSYNAEVWAKDAIEPIAAATRFAEFCKRFADIEMRGKRSGLPYWVAQLAGHNADKFDAPFIQELFRRLEMFLPAGYRVLCTMQLAAWHFHGATGGANSPADYKLQTLCRFYGHEPTEAHDALADVRSTIALYKSIRNAPVAAAI